MTSTATKQNTKIAKTKQPIKAKVRRTYGSWVDCKQNLEKWGVDGSIDAVRTDHNNRRDLPTSKGILIMHDGSRRVIPGRGQTRLLKDRHSSHAITQ